MLESPEGRRVVSTSPEVGIELADATDATVKEVTGLDLDLKPKETVVLCAPTTLRSVPEGTLTGVDPEQRLSQRHGMRYWRSIAQRGVVLFPSRVHLSLLRPGHERTAARILANETDVPVVARLDRDGAFAVMPNGSGWSVSDSEAVVVDTTGAGDAMAGATMSALATGQPLRVAVGIGVSVARVALSKWGPDGLLHHPPLRAPLPGVVVTEA
jgi:sugar/nucleoside kinase (ribokinase family)